MRSTFAAAALLALLADAPQTGSLDPEPPALSAFGFMAGCWRGLSGDGAVIEEYYTAPTENLILGLSRYTKGGRVTGHEFTTLARGEAGVVLTPHPSGQRAVPFRLTALDSTGALWDNPAHDFPTRISYRRGAGDSLLARIEGPGERGRRSIEWRMGRVTCGE